MCAIARVRLRPCTRVLLSSARLASLGDSGDELRKKFWEKEAAWAAGVDFDSLSSAEKRVHLAHEEAIISGHFTYEDPLTGLRVMTRLRHFLRGKCCGNACRHCIYDLKNAAVELRKKRRFNTSFFIDIEHPGFECKDEEKDVDYDAIFRSIEPRPRGM